MFRVITLIKRVADNVRSDQRNS